MTDSRRQWWIVGSLAAVVLFGLTAAAQDLKAQESDVSEAQRSSLVNFWDKPSYWSNLSLRKGLRATGEADLWTVVVDFGETGDWHQQGLLREIARVAPNEPQPLTEEMRAAFDSVRGVLVVAEVVGGGQPHQFVVGFIIQDSSIYQDTSGDPILPFAPLHVGTSHEAAVEFAEAYSDLYDGEMDDMAMTSRRLRRPLLSLGRSLDEQADGEDENSLSKKCPCEDGCNAEFDDDNTLCAATAVACNTAATAAFILCTEKCGVSLACQTGCGLVYFSALGICTLDAVQCRRQADRNLRQCLINCSL